MGLDRQTEQSYRINFSFEIMQPCMGKNQNTSKMTIAADRHLLPETMDQLPLSPSL